jgi:type IV secretion system protein VirB10
MSGVAEQRDPAIYIPTQVQTPISEYQIMAGTVLPAMLVTEISSDLPGEILAQVSRNIYDSQQKYLLIPRGTRVIGRYDSQVALGQSRALIAWTRLIFPDGRSLSLPGLPTQDLRGAAGIRSRVNNHTGRLYGQAILLSIMGAGAQLSQPRTSSVLTPPSAGQVAAGALGQELSQVSMETIRRNMDVRPTLQVRAGTPFSIFLERDLVLEGPYVDAR